MEKIFFVKNVDELREIVDLILNMNLKSPVVLLYGNLGAGKTELVRMFAKHFKIENVSSPTFNIVHIYENEKVRISHIDLYRITNINYVLELDIFHLFEDSDFTFIEWPEILDHIDLVDYHLIKIFFEIQDEKRKVRVVC
ncbi:MAG: tRNA (adenosine(37)-N6)-threonylcarbamoyltransferase complex ATPase subunit type 1 TsaE [candidate division WOR-3 bacterium]